MLNIDKFPSRDNSQFQVMADFANQILRGGRFRLATYRAKPVYEKGIWVRDEFLDDLPLDVQETNNIYVNSGGALLLDLVMGAGGNAYNNTNSYIGIGDSSTAPAVGQTDLVAATNKLRKAMDATFPSRASQVSTFRSTFATGDANWVWNEIGLFNAAAAGTMLCRALVSSPFTKTSGISVVATYTLTVP